MNKIKKFFSDMEWSEIVVLIIITIIITIVIINILFSFLVELKIIKYESKKFDQEKYNELIKENKKISNEEDDKLIIHSIIQTINSIITNSTR